MATHHQVAHAKGGSDLKIAFTALVGGLLWIVVVGVAAHFLALGPSSAEGGPGHEEAGAPAPLGSPLQHDLGN